MDDHQLQLQIPHFVYNTNPTLVPGGGAEVVPVANANWFLQNGFTPTLINHPFFTSQPPAQEDHEQAQDSTSGPFDFSLPPQQAYEQPAQPLPTPDLSVFLADPPPSLIAPSPLGLPVYSASGFDLLSILARVSTRPYPRVVLGPVDLTCSFVVVDIRRFDHPIVYCSPSFCALTGYSEAEVLGRNCRFLQAPGGEVQKGEPRKFTSQDAVNHLRKSLMADKECQSSILNYKKNGAAFINLVTVIPVPGGVSGDDQEIAYQVGFQVDLTEQPNAILEKLRDGSYLINYGGQSDLAPFGLSGHGVQRHIQSASLHQNSQSANARDRKANAIPPVVMSKVLKRLLADPVFNRSLPITPSAPAVASSTTPDDAPSAGVNHPLHLLLLEASPDFIHVVSLKGSFLYVAPSVRRVLGYEADEMIGTSLADYAHPEDVIPLMRELKESSATGPAANAGETNNFSPQLSVPRNVDLLFRAKTKMGRYVWVECRGRLFVEPGKGRKAIILVGRAREMLNLKWEDIQRAGGLAKGLRVREGPPAQEKPVYQLIEQEVWGVLGGACKETLTFMSVGKGMVDVLGWTSDDLLGKNVMDIVSDASRNKLHDIVVAMRYYQQQQRLPVYKRGLSDSAKMKQIGCQLRKKDGSVADVWFIVYRGDPDYEEQEPVNEERGAGLSISPADLVYQIRLVNAETISCGPDAGILQALSQTSSASSGKSATSSVAGSSSVANVATSSSPTVSSPAASTDMFDELSVSRESSWQYELQQLRITNLKLQEELAELEAKDAALQNQAAAQQPSQTSPGYEPSRNGVYDTPVYADVPHHQLYAAHPNQIEQYSPHQLQFDSQTQRLVSSNQSYLHHPQPVQQYSALQNIQYSPSAGPTTYEEPLQKRGNVVRGQRGAQPRSNAPLTTMSPMAWGPMVPPPSDYAGVNPHPHMATYSVPITSLKRSWSNIDAA